MPDVILDVVSPAAADLNISDAIVGGELDRTIDGASTLTLQLHDPHNVIVRGIQRATDLQYDGTWWRLVKISKSGVTVTLTFEDRDVAYLRRHTKPRKVSRGKQTRAQFIRTLVREVKANRIRFFCPEVNEKQKIGKTAEETGTTRRTERTRTDNKQQGISKDAQVSVKGVGASATQRRYGERCLDVAAQLGAGPKAAKALMEAVIVESGIQNLSHGDRDSLGILQVRVSTSGSRERSLDIEWCCKQFLTKGFYTDPQLGGGGAIAIARRHPEASAGRVAQATQGSGVPGAYDIFADEAQDWLDAYGGMSGNDTGGTTTTTSVTRKRYEFSRGEPGKREDSWTCIQRLADEVNWRAFMDFGTLYYVSEDRLISAKAKYIVSEDTDGISWIDFDFDTGKKVSEVTVTARTDLFDVRIGSVMAIRELGVANGRYLVAGVRRSLFDNDTEISLKRATPKLDEPAPETQTSTTTSDLVKASGPMRDRIVQIAKASAKNYEANKQAWFYSQRGSWNTDDPTQPPKRGNRSDCSQWVAAVYKKAGAPAPGPNYDGIYTGNMRVNGREVSTKDAQPGDIILYGPAPSHHVELYVGPDDQTIGHGSAPVDAGTVNMMADPHCWRYDFLDGNDDSGKTNQELSSKYGWGH